MARNTDTYRAYMREYMITRYHERRAEAIAILGGRCVECGETTNLDVDHIDKRYKTMSVSRMAYVSRERFLAELALCQLLCKPHHIEKTSKEQSVPHGGGLTGKKNCYCTLCAPLKKEYNRKFKEKKISGMADKHG